MSSIAPTPPAPPANQVRSSATPRSWRRRLLKYGLRTGAVALALTGLMGALHLPFAAPVLRLVFAFAPSTVCPVTRGTPEQIDRAHALGAAAIRDSARTAAPVRPALGFRLDQTRKSDLDAWAAAHGVSCASIGGNQNLQRCRAIPASAVGAASDLGPLEELTFEFQASGALVNVQTLRRGLSAGQAARVVGRLEQQAAAALGPPSTLGGAATAEHLSRAVLASFVAVHSFTDYQATVSATNLASTGVMVREQYLSAR